MMLPLTLPSPTRGEGAARDALRRSDHCTTRHYPLFFSICHTRTLPPGSLVTSRF